MPTFILSLNWTEQGIRSVKDAPKRAEASKELAKKVGVEIKQVYLTTGEGRPPCHRRRSERRQRHKICTRTWGAR